jgi:hypothetical protein
MSNSGVGTQATEMEATTITIERTKTGKLKLSGQAALGFSSATKSLDLTIGQIAQIADLYNRSVFQNMLDNNQFSLIVGARHHDEVHLNEHVKRVSTPPPTAMAPLPQSPPSSSPSQSPSPSPSPSSSPSPPPLQENLKVNDVKNQMWHTYVRLFKSQNPDLTHQQAVARAKLSYPEWKKAQ